MPLSDIRSILTATDAVVIVDEAYVDFGGQSAAGLIDEYPNLLVVHTFSKSGRRRHEDRSRFRRQRADTGAENVKNSFNSYTLDRLALVAGIAALEDDEYYRGVNRKVAETRDWFTAELRKRDFNVADS